MSEVSNCIIAEVSGGILRLELPIDVLDGKPKQLCLELKDIDEESSVNQTAQNIHTVELYELWDKYSQFKLRLLSHISKKDFLRVQRHIEKLPTQSLKESTIIFNYLVDNLTPETAKRVIMQLNACCNWSVDRGLIKSNPFDGLSGKIKVKKNRNINPFSVAERDAIIQAFKADDYHHHYLAFVQFLFSTGCRTSEAIGLCWKHVNPSWDYLTFCEAVVEGKRSLTTKTKSLRKFPINCELEQILSAVKPDEVLPEQPVFTSEKGALVSANNFSRRHWRPVVESLGFQYRSQYTTRHTFITLCLDRNIPIAQVASWVGNSPKIILEHYAGLTKSEVPVLY